MPRRSTVTRALAVVALSLVPAAPAAASGPATSGPAVSGPTAFGPAVSGPVEAVGRADGGDRLLVTVSDSGDPAREGTYALYCHPAAGNHPEAKGACDGLDEVTVWGKDPFAPVGPGAHCTQVYGGPAKAHVRGRWAGRPVDAWFARTDGCQIERWDRAVPLLPKLS